MWVCQWKSTAALLMVWWRAFVRSPERWGPEGLSREVADQPIPLLGFLVPVVDGSPLVRLVRGFALHGGVERLEHWGVDERGQPLDFVGRLLEGIGTTWT